MGSISPRKIPTINFSNKDLMPGTDCWNSVRAKIRQALEIYGCFEAEFDEIQLRQQMLGVIELFFNLSKDIKIKYKSKDDVFNGYHGDIPYLPMYESLTFNDVLEHGKLQSFTNLMWPEGNSTFCEILCSYLNQVIELEQMVMKMVLESFDVEPYNQSQVGSTSYILQVMKYGVPRTNKTRLGLVPHQDKSFVTVLGQNDVHGLEIQAKDGEWICVKPSASSFVVIIGDPFMKMYKLTVDNTILVSHQAWSNDRLHCPVHRVMMDGDITRYSMGLFSTIHGTIQTPEVMVDEEHPLLYKPFNHIEYRKFFQTEEGGKAECPIKAFCGI
ncbi:hypothetical protein ACHQM5_008797 [Ranunculus cassubicifolius]